MHEAKCKLPYVSPFRFLLLLNYGVGSTDTMWSKLYDNILRYKKLLILFKFKFNIYGFFFMHKTLHSKKFEGNIKYIF